MVSETRLEWSIGPPTSCLISLVEKLDNSFLSFPLCSLKPHFFPALTSYTIIFIFKIYKLYIYDIMLTSLFAEVEPLVKRVNQWIKCNT